LDRWIFRYVSGQTDRQTDMLITMLCTHTGGKVNILFWGPP